MKQILKFSNKTYIFVFDVYSKNVCNTCTCTWNFVLGKLGNWCSLVSSVHCQSELEVESERVQALHKIETRYLTWLMSAEGTCRKQLLWSRQPLSVGQKIYAKF